MKKEDELYIESELYKIVSLYAEADYELDKFGNIIFKDKSKVLQNISNVIDMASKEKNIPIDEIENYLIQVCKGKIEETQNPIFEREETEIIFIIEEIKNKRMEENKKEELKTQEPKTEGKENNSLE